jgi:hypothetical protein
MAKRKTRDEIEISDSKMLKPLDIETFGSDKDPCFGKLYDLTTPECKRCGDSEICAIVFSQKMNSTREKVEKNNRFKDLELETPVKDIEDYIKGLKKKGYKESKIIRLTKKKFDISRKTVKEIM